MLSVQWFRRFSLGIGRRFIALLAALGCAGPLQAQVQRIHLANEAITVELTPDIGGRLLSISLAGQENFLRVGEPVISEPEPYIGPDADNIGYLGHEIWLGPQSQWWQQQLINRARAQEKAVWPPDPYLIFSRSKLLSANAQQVAMRSPASPVSGVVIDKHFSLLEGAPNQLQLTVAATNVRDTQVAWDIWFNTRVPPITQVYVPVMRERDLRVEPAPAEGYGPLQFSLSDGLFTLEQGKSTAGLGQRGKAFIQPSAGWMAAFRNQQVLIIRFPLQPLVAIHPEQGQVELYLEYRAERPEEGLLEMELHAPYRQLKPDEQMQASQTWELLAYTGEHTPAAHRAFLRSQGLAF